MATVIATRSTKRVMERRTADRLAEQGGVAASFPASTCALVITPTRLVALPSNGLTFKPPPFAVDRAGVRAELIGLRGAGRRMSLRFSDGSTAEVDVQLGQPLTEFVAALTPSIGTSPLQS